MGESVVKFCITGQRLWLYIEKIMMTKSWKNRKCALSSSSASLLPLCLLHSQAWVLVCLLAWVLVWLLHNQDGVLVWGSFIVCLSFLPRSDTVNCLDGFQDTVRQRKWNLSVSVCLDSVVYNI